MSASGKTAENLRLTEAGLQVRERLLASVIAVEDHIMAPLSESEREMFRGLALRVIKASDVEVTEVAN